MPDSSVKPAGRPTACGDDAGMEPFILPASHRQTGGTLPPGRRDFLSRHVEGLLNVRVLQLRGYDTANVRLAGAALPWTAVSPLPWPGCVAGWGEDGRACAMPTPSASPTHPLASL